MNTDYRITSLLPTTTGAATFSPSVVWVRAGGAFFNQTQFNTTAGNFDYYNFGTGLTGRLEVYPHRIKVAETILASHAPTRDDHGNHYDLFINFPYDCFWAPESVFFISALYSIDWAYN